MQKDGTTIGIVRKRKNLNSRKNIFTHENLRGKSTPRGNKLISRFYDFDDFNWFQMITLISNDFRWFHVISSWFRDLKSVCSPLWETFDERFKAKQQKLRNTHRSTDKHFYSALYNRLQQGNIYPHQNISLFRSLSQRWFNFRKRLSWTLLTDRKRFSSSNSLVFSFSLRNQLAIARYRERQPFLHMTLPSFVELKKSTPIRCCACLFDQLENFRHFWQRTDTYNSIQNLEQVSKLN